MTQERAIDLTTRAGLGPPGNTLTGAVVHRIVTTELPDVVQRYQGAHDRHDTEAALATFAEGAHVHDDGQDHHGLDAIRRWLDTTAAAFTYTRTLLDAGEEGDGRWLVVSRLVGDFPGGEVDLRYRFTVVGDRITELVIAP